MSQILEGLGGESEKCRCTGWILFFSHSPITAHLRRRFGLSCSAHEVEHPLPKSQCKCAINRNEEERTICANLELSYLGLLDERTASHLFSGCRYCRNKPHAVSARRLKFNLCTDQLWNASAVSLTILRSKPTCLSEAIGESSHRLLLIMYSKMFFIGLHIMSIYIDIIYM